MESFLKAVVSYYVCTKLVCFTVGHMTASREQGKMNFIFPYK